MAQSMANVVAAAKVGMIVHRMEQHADFLGLWLQVEHRSPSPTRCPCVVPKTLIVQRKLRQQAAFMRLSASHFDGHSTAGMSVGMLQEDLLLLCWDPSRHEAHSVEFDGEGCLCLRSSLSLSCHLPYSGSSLSSSTIPLPLPPVHTTGTDALSRLADVAVAAAESAAMRDSAGTATTPISPLLSPPLPPPPPPLTLPMTTTTENTADLQSVKGLKSKPAAAAIGMGTSQLQSQERVEGRFNQSLQRIQTPISAPKFSRLTPTVVSPQVRPLLVRGRQKEVWITSEVERLSDGFMVNLTEEDVEVKTEKLALSPE